jgi:hypothetical protein
VIFLFFWVSFFVLEHKITHLTPPNQLVAKVPWFFLRENKAQKAPQNAFSKTIPFNIHFHFEQERIPPPSPTKNFFFF